MIIAGAGGAAHLPGMVAALTPLPVVGVPVKSAGAHLDGLDALLSIVQVESHPSSILKSQSWVPDSSPDAWTPKVSGMPELSREGQACERAVQLPALANLG